MDIERLSILGWLEKEQIVTEAGLPYDLRSRLFWFDPVRDWSQKIVWLKAAQLGGTTASLLRMVWLMNYQKANAIYTMPTASDVEELASGKMNPLMNMNPSISAMISDKDSVRQKRIGNNTVYFRGTMTERAALSISADLLIHDEEDRSNRKIIEQYASRLQASDRQMEWHFSNPSARGQGVDRYWAESDQKHWFIRCSKCSKQQYLSWPDSIDYDRECYVCKHCHAELSSEERRLGAWHGKVLEAKAKFSGYWFNGMMAPWLTASYIIEQFNQKSTDYFYNFVLGLPYESPGAKLTESQFFANVTSETYALTDPIVIGVDPGLPNWYVVMNREGMFACGHTEGYDEFRRMMKDYPKAILVSDAGGDLWGPRELQDEFPGRVFLCHYRRDRKTMQLVNWGSGEETGVVVADRNRVIQLLMDEWRARRIPMRGEKEDWWEFWTHIENMYRVFEEDSLGQETFIWQRSGPDHLVHAAVYARVGMDKFGMSESTAVKPPPGPSKLKKAFEADPLTGKVPFEQFLSAPKPRDWRKV